MTITVTDVKTGVDRWAEDTQRRINLDKYYKPFDHQQRFHTDPHKYRLLGGAAGPGKTLAGLFELVMSANEHEDGSKVQNLGLRRTVPELEKTLLLRFRQMVPRELYRSFQEQQKIVHWWNGARTYFGSMQYREDVWVYQGGQWKEVYWDELTQFILPYQWVILSGWNRCDIAPAGMCAGTNPVGISAMWVKQAFVDHKLPTGMEAHQYDPADYGFTPAKISDNPIYATDATYLATLEKLPARLRAALLYGLWDAALGGYFENWDPGIHVYPGDLIQVPHWCPRWIGIDWGYEHPTAVGWHATDPDGVYRTYRELVTNHTYGSDKHVRWPKMGPRALAEEIVKQSFCMAPQIDERGEVMTSQPEQIRQIFLSHDAFAQRTDAHTIARQMGDVFAEAGLPRPTLATMDKIGSSMLLHELLDRRVRQEMTNGEVIQVPCYQVADCCEAIAEVFPLAGHDDKEPEKIAKFDGDDPLDQERYALYGYLKPRQAPPEEQIEKKLQQAQSAKGRPLTPTERGLAIRAQLDLIESNKGKTVLRPRRWRPQTH